MDESRRVKICVGIDVLKDRLDAHVIRSGEALPVARDDKGLESLVARRGALDVSLIVLEATGGFGTTVAAALAGAGFRLAVVNPRQIRSFAKALGKLGKTDAIETLFADKVRPQVRPMPTRALGELVAKRRQIVEMIIVPANRRGLATDKRLVKTSLSSDAKCNTPRRFDIGKVVQDLKECCHAILFASLGRRKRPNRHFAGRGAVDGGHCPGARSGENNYLQGAAAERTLLGRVFPASRRRSLSIAQAA
jgi:Transposase